VRTATLLFALAFVVRGGLFVLFPDPAYPDAAYYVDVARALASGHGLHVDFVWIFAEVGGRLPLEPVLPIPSNAHWLPLASFLQAPFIAVLGPTAFASALPMLLVGSLAAPLTWAIARDLGASRTVQVGAGILAAIPAAGTVFMAQPENFAIFQPLVAATIWLAARGLRGDGRSYALAGLLVGLASIARNDAFLLGGAVGLVFVVEVWRARRDQRPSRISWQAVAGCVALYLLIVGPWWARQLVTFGSISPTASAGPTLWLTDYAQWNSITADTSFTAFLAQGPAGILGSRLFGLSSAVMNFAVIVGSVVLVPLIALGAWRRRRSADLLPWFLYAGLLFTGATLLFPLHVPGGAFIHSAVGLGPHAYILALEAVAAIVAWANRRRPAADTARLATFASGAVVVFVVATAAIYAPAVQRGWDTVRAPRQQLAAAIDGLGVAADDRLFSIDAGGFKYWTGRPGVVTPNDPIDTIHDVAVGYDIRWLVLERGSSVAALAPILAGGARPAWIGGAVFTVVDDQPDPSLALYPVCTTATDTRCGGGA
jgi:4-amino-4-deoxy-L-arabinose transferase-like glycosyltransferase